MLSSCLPACSRQSGGAQSSRSTHCVYVEACSPISIKLPFEVTAIGEQGQRGLYVAPEPNTSSNEGGTATYRCFVPAAGQYKAWGYCYWMEGGGGTNVFELSVGGSSGTIPRGPATRQWQWVPLLTANLKEGLATMTLAARGWGFAVRKIVFCDDPLRHGEQCGAVTEDLFYDDFNDCHEGQFDSWQKCSGKWTVEHDDDYKSPAEKVLVGRCQEEAFVCIGDSWGGDYCLTVDCRTIHSDAGGKSGIRFCMDGDAGSLLLCWTCDGSQKQARIELLRETLRGCTKLAEFAADWQERQWHEVSLSLQNETVSILVDSLPLKTVAVGPIHGGGIGLCLFGPIEMQFDNVQVHRRDGLSPASREADANQGAASARQTQRGMIGL